MKALLVFPKQFQMAYMKLQRDYEARRYPPLGLMYVSASLKEEGLSVDLIDMTADDTTPELLLNKIITGGYLFAGFYADTTTKYSVLEYINMIKKQSGIPIIIGGPSSMDPQFFLSSEGVTVVHGEGERVIKQIVSALKEKKDFSHIKGVSFRKNGLLISDRATPLVENLDSLPFPDRAAINMDKYHDYYNLNYRGGRFATIIASRGCPINCVYCASSNMWGKKIRSRSAANVIDEVRHITSKYNVRYIDFVDDIFNLNKKWLNDFCDNILKEKIKIRFSCNMYPMDTPADLLRKVRLAGGNTIKLGVQSSDESVLKNINRNPDTVEKARRFIESAKKIGFIIYSDFIFGLVGETEESLQKNIDFAVTANPHIVKFYKLDVLEGSDLHSDKTMNAKITDLSDDTLRQYCKIAWKKFYLRPIKFFELFVAYLRNPVMFRIILRHLNIINTFLGK